MVSLFCRVIDELLSFVPVISILMVGSEVIAPSVGGCQFSNMACIAFAKTQKNPRLLKNLGLLESIFKTDLID